MNKAAKATTVVVLVLAAIAELGAAAWPGRASSSVSGAPSQGDLPAHAVINVNSVAELFPHSR